MTILNDPILEANAWFDAVRPEPTASDLCVQIGCKLEEEAEFLAALGLYDISAALANVADKFKAKGPIGLHSTRRLLDSLAVEVEVLDALCDSTVTNIGIANFLGANFHGALAEVNRSNKSKFVNGKPIFDTNGKLKKGPDFSKPELKPFAGRGQG